MSIYMKNFSGVEVQDKPCVCRVRIHVHFLFWGKIEKKDGLSFLDVVQL